MEVKTSFRDLLQVLFYRKNLIFTLFVTVVLGTGIATMLTTPIYESSSTLLIEKEPNLPGTVQNAQQITLPPLLSTAQEAAEMARTQSEIIKSRVVLRKALEHLKLAEGPEREVVLRVAELQKRITVTPVQDTTDLIQIRVQHPIPQTAADMSNAAAKAYVEWYIERKKGKASEAVAYLNKQLAELGKELDAVESQLLALKEEGGLVSVEEQIRTALARLSEFEAERRKALAQEEENKTKLTKIRAQLTNPDETLLAASRTASDPYVETLRRKILDLEFQLSTLKGSYTDESGPVLQLKQELEAGKDLLNKAQLQETAPEFSGNNPIYQSLVSELVSLEVEQEAVRVRKEYIERYLEEYRSQVADLAEKEKEYNYLMRQIQAKENLYMLLQNRREEAATAESLKEEGITTVMLLDPAEPSQHPIYPNPVTNLLLGCAVGLITGIGTASLVEYFDHSLKGVDDVERHLGLSVLGTIPRGPSGKFGRKKKQQGI
ncbi:MAG: GumC family protein [Candidatus Omnitrophota bacterium]